MTDQGGASQAKRVVEAEKYRGETLMGKIEIHAHTKHGPTAMLSVFPPETLEPGDTLKTKAWIFGAKNFVVERQHAKPMKLGGVWYEVRIVKPKP